MIKQEFEYQDFNGHPRKAEMYFNLTDLEVLDFSGRRPRGVTEDLDVMVNTENIRGILAFIRALIEASYGIKSEDGVTFEKSPEITRKFIQSAYYSDWLFSLFENDAEKGIAFVQQVLPASLIESAQKRVDLENSATGSDTHVKETYGASAREQFATRSEARAAGQ